MAQFKNHQESHEHSLQTLEILYGYDSFLDSLETVADMGCGRGLDIGWFARLQTRDQPPEPRNYYCYAFDKNIKLLDSDVKELDNIYILEGDFERQYPPRKVDLMWCHDSFQYVTNPLSTLKNWNYCMNENGMLVIIYKQNIATEYNRLVTRGDNFCFFNHNLINFVYMLAVNGFDCKDAYVKKQENDPWLHIAVYKSTVAPMNPQTTSWFDLADKDLLHPSILNSLNLYGYVKQEEIVYPWLDKDLYRVRT
jgi:SAM-dependent methyltransferase